VVALPFVAEPEVGVKSERVMAKFTLTYADSVGRHEDEYSAILALYQRDLRLCV